MTSDATNSSPFGDYFGHELTALECERLALERIDGKHLAKETKLFESKWFDYRRMHPTQATYLFAFFFDAAHKALIRERVDFRIENWTSFKGKDFLKIKPTEYHGFWKARQKADELGLPYDFYCNAAIRWADKSLWRRLPRPTQVYSEKIIESITSQWRVLCEAKIPLPLDGYYSAAAYRGEDEQQRFQRWLCERIDARPNSEMALASHLQLEPWLVREIAEDFFGSAMVARADAFCLRE